MRHEERQIVAQSCQRVRNSWSPPWSRSVFQWNDHHNTRLVADGPGRVTLSGEVLGQNSFAGSADSLPDALTFFQYPNFKPNKPDNLRQMAVLSAPDLELFRGDAGIIVKVTDVLLSDSVCSYRLNRSGIRGTAWGFDRANSWKDWFLAGGMEILDKGEFPFMCRTDISKDGSRLL